MLNNFQRQVARQFHTAVDTVDTVVDSSVKLSYYLSSEICFSFGLL